MATPISTAWAAAAVAAVVVGGQDTLLYFERRRNQAKLSVWSPPPPRPRCRCCASCFPFLFFFGFSLLFICHNSVPKRAAVFPRVALFLVVVVAFITFRFIHLFRCSLLAVRCCLHSFRTRRFNSTFDSFFPFPVSLSSVSLHISRFAFGNKANSSKPGLMRHSDEYCIRLRSLESYEC